VARFRHGGREIEISGRLRTGGDDLLLFLHGIGCGKAMFDTAFDAPELAGFSLCAFDFPGHGNSPPLPSTRHSVEAYADITWQVLAELSPRRVFLMGHSLGGAVGLVACAGLGNLAHFVNVEGNLVAQDCGLVSRNLAEQPALLFRERGFAEFLRQLRGSTQPDLRIWATWYALCDPTAVHQVAGSLVEWSDAGKLLEIFRALPRKSYVYGDEGNRLEHLLPSLRSIPQHAIVGAGHFPMVDNPPVFYRTLGELCLLERPG
jgi:pimeloyl-ACP methyl ester carboxylesterase